MEALNELKSNCSWLESLMADEMYMNGPTVEDIWATKISNDTMELAMGLCGRGEQMKRSKLSDFEGSYLHNVVDSCTLSACQNTFSLGVCL